MRYGKISEAIWADDKFQGLTDGSKLLYIYLLSCENCNSVGIFRIGAGMIEDGFGTSRDRIGQNMSELEQCGLIGYKNGWLWFNKYLKWNEPTSPNHAKQCASYINDCVRREAPVEAVWGFLSTVHSILGKMGQKAQEKGSERTSYFDCFIKSLNRDEVVEFLGGEDAYRSCINGKKLEPLKSTAADLNKTFGALRTDKGSRSTDEALSKHYRSTSNTNNNNNKDKDNNKTRQDNDNKSIVLACNNKQEVTEISLYCSDGQIHKVSNQIIVTAGYMIPGFDLDRFKTYLQKQNIISPETRPDTDQDSIDEYVMKMASQFEVNRGGYAT